MAALDYAAQMGAAHPVGNGNKGGPKPGRGRGDGNAAGFPCAMLNLNPQLGEAAHTRSLRLRAKQVKDHVNLDSSVDS